MMKAGLKKVTEFVQHPSHATDVSQTQAFEIHIQCPSQYSTEVPF